MDELTQAFREQVRKMVVDLLDSHAELQGMLNRITNEYNTAKFALMYGRLTEEDRETLRRLDENVSAAQSMLSGRLALCEGNIRQAVGILGETVQGRTMQASIKTQILQACVIEPLPSTIEKPSGDAATKLNPR